MSPPLSLIVGLVIALVHTAAADVKHILIPNCIHQQQQQQQAGPPLSPPHTDAARQANDINYLGGSSGHSFASSFASSTGGGGVLPQSTNTNPNEYWWMNANSPFKDAYDFYKKCASKGNCPTPVLGPNAIVPPHQSTLSGSGSGSISPPQTNAFPTIDVARNPFLNGQFQGVAFSSCSGTACKNGKEPQTIITTCKGTQCQSAEVKPDLRGNPFLNGGITLPGLTRNSITSSSSSANGVDLANNPFFNGGQFGGTVTTGNGAAIPKGTTGFLGVQPAKPFATSHPLANKKPFSTVHPLEAAKKQIECRGAGRICVQNQLCGANGIVISNGEGLFQVRSDVQYCDANSETCCQLPNAPTQTNTILNHQSKFELNLPQLNDNAERINNDFASTITAGKSSVPGSTIKFTGGAGLSPGSIQVLPINHDDQTNEANSKANIYVSSSSGTNNAIITPKPTRDTTSSPNSLFSFAGGSSSTVDYSDTKFDDNVRFESTLKGPAYLPPVGNNDRPAPPPVISTYQPSIPTTPKPYRPPVSNSFSTTTTKPPPKPFEIPVFVAPPSTGVVPISPPVHKQDYLPPRPAVPTYTNVNTQPFSTTQRPTIAPPNPSSGYVYNQPTPAFNYPTSPKPSATNHVVNEYVRPNPKPVNNGYLPPIYPSGSSTSETFVTRPDNTPDSANNNNVNVLIPTTRRTTFTGELNTAPPPGCAAALKCVQEIYCTAEGVVSPVPVVLTKEQETNRVPTTVCHDQGSGIIGKCCRDPNYKDPWPSANLINGVDDGQYKEDANLGQYSQQKQRSIRSGSGGPRQDQSNGNVQPNQLAQNQENNQQAPTCGQRHLNTRPAAPGPLDVNFSEIPWQAMILRDTNRSLLCGGAIIRRDAVLTAAHCVDGLDTKDVLIKGGEWKLGIDEEPLPFQIVKVAVIVRHPDYKRGATLQNDLAVLILAEKLRPAKNIATICLPQPNQIPTQNCIATGWGKRILQLHAKGAIMHAIGVNIMDNQLCQKTLTEQFQNSVPNYSPNTLCGYSNIDQCRVDYGSALACEIGPNQYTLSGIFAWDTGCKQQGQIGGYVAPDVEWIDSCLAKPLNELKRLERDYNNNVQYTTN